MLKSLQIQSKASLPKSLLNLIRVEDAQRDKLKLAMLTKSLCAKLPAWG